MSLPSERLLLAVPMERLGPCPAMAIDQHHTNDFPPQAVTHQGFTRLRVVSLTPKQHDSHRVCQGGDPHLFAEVPIARTPHPHGLLRLPGNLPRHLLQWLLPPCIDDLPIELQVANIRALLA